MKYRNALSKGNPSGVTLYLKTYAVDLGNGKGIVGANTIVILVSQSGTISSGDSQMMDNRNFLRRSAVENNLRKYQLSKSMIDFVKEVCPQF